MAPALSPGSGSHSQRPLRRRQTYLAAVTMADTQFCIPANSDVSGIGVRVAIYVQNFLSFVPAFWALWDGEVSAHELDNVETQSTTILITAFAILLSAMVQAQTFGLSNFHAAIVLSLSWMNNTNTFIYFLLYIQHKSGGEKHQVDATWGAWIRHVFARELGFKELPTKPDRRQTHRGTRATSARMVHAARRLMKLSSRDSPREADIEMQNVAATGGPDTLASGTKTRRRQLDLHRFSRQFVPLLGSLHLSLMAALGLWLWHDPGSFSLSKPCIADFPSLTIIGRNVPLISNGLRGASIFLYSLMLAPGLNLLAPMAVFLALHILYQRWHHSRCSGQSLPVSIVAGLLLLFAINIIFVADIELTIHRNRRVQDDSENQWNFGQILAMLLLAIPLRDVVEAVIQRRIQREKERQMIQATNDLIQAVHQRNDLGIFDAVAKGADVNKQLEEDVSTVIQFAYNNNNHVLFAFLMSHDADPATMVDNNRTILQKAWDDKKMELVRTIIEYGKIPMIDTMLQAACDEGELDIVQVLLKKGANPNVQDGEYGTALQAASAKGHLDIVQLLLQQGADPNIKGEYIFCGIEYHSQHEGGEFDSALKAAIKMKHTEIAKLLKEKEAVQ
ncbi:ankyrin [Panus rudis PR-1116 ss-1]|nr:ankyrin [Panus rudis PR-1116 ss-1]